LKTGVENRRKPIIHTSVGSIDGWKTFLNHLLKLVLPANDYTLTDHQPNSQLDRPQRSKAGRLGEMNVDGLLARASKSILYGSNALEAVGKRVMNGKLSKSWESGDAAQEV